MQWEKWTHFSAQKSENLVRKQMIRSQLLPSSQKLQARGENEVARKQIWSHHTLSPSRYAREGGKEIGCEVPALSLSLVLPFSTISIRSMFSLFNARVAQRYCFPSLLRKKARPPFIESTLLYCPSFSQLFTPTPQLFPLQYGEDSLSHFPLSISILAMPFAISCD